MLGLDVFKICIRLVFPFSFADEANSSHGIPPFICASMSETAEVGDVRALLWSLGPLVVVGEGDRGGGESVCVRAYVSVHAMRVSV